MQDTSWLDVYLSEVPHVVYQVDDWDKTDGAQHRTLVNKGNEAMAYLQFILDYWGRLPASIVFLHGHRWRLPPARRCPMLLTLPKVSGCLCKRGNEATAYLQFILENQGRPPASIVFLNGGRCAANLVKLCGAAAQDKTLSPDLFHMIH